MNFRTVAMIFLSAGLSCQAIAAQPGQQAPLLALPQLDSAEMVLLSDLKGKVVYVDFWASWCGPCRQSLPLYEQLLKKLPADQFQLLAVNLDENRKDAEKFLNRHPVSYTVLLDPAGNSARDWGVKVMPTSYLVDTNGLLVKVYHGFEPSHIGTIENDIKSLLHSPATPRPDHP